MKPTIRLKCETRGKQLWRFFYLSVKIGSTIKRTLYYLGPRHVYKLECDF